MDIKKDQLPTQLPSFAKAKLNKNSKLISDEGGSKLQRRADLFMTKRPIPNFKQVRKLADSPGRPKN